AGLRQRGRTTPFPARRFVLLVRMGFLPMRAHGANAPVAGVALYSGEARGPPPISGAAAIRRLRTCGSQNERHCAGRVPTALGAGHRRWLGWARIAGIRRLSAPLDRLASTATSVSTACSTAFIWLTRALHRCRTSAAFGYRPATERGGFVLE